MSSVSGSARVSRIVIPVKAGIQAVLEGTSFYFRENDGSWRIAVRLQAEIITTLGLQPRVVELFIAEHCMHELTQKKGTRKVALVMVNLVTRNG